MRRSAWGDGSGPQIWYNESSVAIHQSFQVDSISMGCDIHAHLELIDQPALHVARFELPRNYRLFSLLAGVRYDPQEFRGFEPVYEPRGLPSGISSTVFEACTYAINDELAALDVDGYCSREAAERWIANGAATYCDPSQERVTDPDWHSVSWVTCDELETVAIRYQQITGERDAWLDAIIGAMHAFAIHQTPNRLIFWFKG
jgi:hypothetical protein